MDEALIGVDEYEELLQYKERWEKLRVKLEEQQAQIGSEGPAIAYAHELLEEMEEIENG